MSAHASTTARRRFTADEFHRMAEAGIFHEDDRLELIDGEIIAMSPIGAAHMRCVLHLDRFFNEQVAEANLEDIFVSVQNPLRLAADQEPEPDMALLHLPRGMDEIPGPEATRLVIEVADTTLAHDRKKAARYGAVGVPETWIVVLDEETVEVYRQPEAEGYAERHRAERGETLDCVALPEMEALAVADVLD